MEDDVKRERKMEEHQKVGKCMKKDVQQREKGIEDLELELVQEALKLPNKTHHDSPVGGEDKKRLVKEPTTMKPELECSHLEIAEHFDLLDFANASKLTGNKFVFMKNEVALLELALCNWVLNLVAKKGFTPLTTPDLAR